MRLGRLVALALLASAATAGPITKKDFARLSSDALAVMFDYEPLAAIRKGLENRIHATDIVLKTLRNTKGRKQWTVAVWWREALDRHARETGIYARFDELIDASRLASEWSRSEDLSLNYTYLVDTYSKPRKGVEENRAAIFLVNFLCELYQRDECSKIKSKWPQFQLEPGIRLVPGGDAILGRTLQAVRKDLKRYEQHYGKYAQGVSPMGEDFETYLKVGHRKFGASKFGPVFWRLARETRVPGGVVLSFFAERGVTNRRMLALLASDHEIKARMVRTSPKQRGRYDVHRWPSRDELPVAGPDHVTLGIKLSWTRLADEFLRKLSKSIDDGKKRDLLLDVEWELLFRTYDGRQWPNRTSLPPAPEEPYPDVELTTPVIEHRPRTSKQRTRQIKLRDSPFGFHGARSFGGCLAYRTTGGSTGTLVRRAIGEDMEVVVKGEMCHPGHLSYYWSLWSHLSSVGSQRGYWPYHTIHWVRVKYPWDTRPDHPRRKTR